MENAISPEFCDEIVEARSSASRRPAAQPAPEPVHRSPHDPVLRPAQPRRGLAVRGRRIPYGCAGVLGEAILLSAIGTAVIGPGEPAQPIHGDDPLYELTRSHKN